MFVPISARVVHDRKFRGYMAANTPHLFFSMLTSALFWFSWRIIILSCISVAMNGSLCIISLFCDWGCNLDFIDIIYKLHFLILDNLSLTWVCLQHFQWHTARTWSGFDSMFIKSQNCFSWSAFLIYNYVSKIPPSDDRPYRLSQMPSCYEFYMSFDFEKQLVVQFWPAHEVKRLCSVARSNNFIWCGRSFKDAIRHHWKIKQSTLFYKTDYENNRLHVCIWQ